GRLVSIFARPGPRFLAEAVAIVLAAAVPGLEHLVWWKIGVFVAAVLLAAIAIESRMSALPAAAPVPDAPPPVEEPAAHVRVLPEKPLSALLRHPLPEPGAVAAPPVRVGGPPFNVWELERAHTASGSGDDEKPSMLHYLRDYASADGTLPSDFDDLVRESFADLL